MLRLMICLVFLSVSAMAAEPAPSIPENSKSFATSQQTMPKLYHQASRKVAGGTLVIGIVLPDYKEENLYQSPQALLYIALQHHDGTVSEVAKTDQFDYRGYGGKTSVETIEITSETKFSIQFNTHGGCAGGYTVYSFALIRNKWRVAGQDINHFSCGTWENGLESMDYYIYKWSANFLTGLIVEREYQGDKLLSSKRSRKVFPAFPIEQFVPFDEKYKPRL